VDGERGREAACYLRALADGATFEVWGIAQAAESFRCRAEQQRARMDAEQRGWVRARLRGWLAELEG
jgi:hypothetical protein